VEKSSKSGGGCIALTGSVCVVGIRKEEEKMIDVSMTYCILSVDEDTIRVYLRGYKDNGFTIMRGDHFWSFFKDIQGGGTGIGRLPGNIIPEEHPFGRHLLRVLRK
jgi:hypothetical protein